MKKLLLLVPIIVIAILISSCSVNPEKALQNLQRPKIKLKTSVNIPVIATEVNTGKLIMSNLEDLKSTIEGLDVIEGSPVKITYNATIFELKPNDISSQIPELSGEIPINFGVNLPTIGEINQSVSINTPSFSSQDISIHVDGLLKGKYTTDSTEISFDLGVDSSKLVAFKVNGAIVISASFPWDDVSLVSVDATITDGNGNVVVSENYPAENNVASIDLSGKELEVGDGSMRIEYSLTIYSDSNHGEGDITLSINPDLDIIYLEGLKLNFNQSVDKPSKVEELDIKRGQLVIESPQLEFAGVSGSVGDNSMSVESGKIVADLGSVNLPVSVSIDTVDATVKSLDGQVDINGALEDLEVATLVYLSSDLAVSSSKNVPLGKLSQLIKSISFSGGTIKLEYDSTLPMDVNVVLKSNDFDPELNKSFVINKNSSAEVTLVDLNGKRLLIDDSFDISFEASPENYDGEKLILENVTLGSNLGINATITIGGIELSKVVLNSTTLSYSGELPIDDMTKGILPYMNMSATLNSNVDINGTIEATFENESGSADLESGSLNDLIEAFKNAVSEMKGNNLNYDVALNINEATIDVSKPLYAKVEAEVPLELDLEDKEIEVPLSDLIKPVDISSLHESDAEVLAATLTIEGTNTSGITPRIEIKVGSTESEVDLKDGAFKSAISVSKEDLSGDTLPISATAVLSGHQLISSDGIVDLKVKLSADLSVTTGGGEGE